MLDARNFANVEPSAVRSLQSTQVDSTRLRNHQRRSPQPNKSLSARAVENRGCEVTLGELRLWWVRADHDGS